jgi:hypothetical protein
LWTVGDQPPSSRSESDEDYEGETGVESRF